MPFHDQLPPPAWHGAKVETGTLAARPIPQVVGQLYFVNSGASAGKLFIAEGTTAQTDWKEVADLNNLPLQLTVRDPSNNKTLTPTTTLVFPTQWLSVSSSTNTATVTMPNAVTVRDQSNAVNQPNVHTIIFPNSSLSSPNSNTVEVTFPSSSSGLTVEDVSQNVSESNVTRIVVPDNTLSVINPGEVELDLSSASGGGSITVRDASGSPSYANIDTLEIAPSNVDTISNPVSDVARIDVRGFELTGVVTGYVKRLIVNGYDFLTPVSTYEYELDAVPNKDVCAVLHISNETITDAVNSSWYYSSLNALGGSFPFSSRCDYSRPSINSNYVYQPQSLSVRLRQPGLYMYKGRLVFRAYNGLAHFLNPDLEVRIEIFNTTTSTGVFTNTHNFPTRASSQFIDDASATSTTYSQGVWFEGDFNLRTWNVSLDFNSEDIELFYNITLNGVLSTASVDIRFEFFEVIRVP